MKTIWLPRDERKVLIYYYKKLQESGVETRGQFFLSELENCLSGNDKRNRVKIASKMLKRRNLLDFYNDQVDAVTVQLSLEGFDLGRKYSSTLGTVWVWCNEYKLWIILGVIIGFITLVVSIIAAIFKD